jgi:hypothetical protein
MTARFLVTSPSVSGSICAVPVLIPQRGCVLQPRVAALRGYPGKTDFIDLNRNAVVSIPNVTLIPFDLVLGKQRSHFILEAHFSMVVFLVRDIPPHLFQV